MTRRHDGLMPLTHDHHHALSHARRLRLSAAGDERARLRQAKEFLAFFHSDALEHFREEEEVVFPLGVGDESALPLLGQTVIEHMKIHALVTRLSVEVAAGRVFPESAIELAGALSAHIRREENEVFPLLEEIVPEDKLRAISLRERDHDQVAAD
jgi:iron-sulfur cluster repair protein YtfE (RIC family)